jgi:hypothetical protein
MKKAALLVALIVAGSAFAGGFSLGFKLVELPTYVYSTDTYDVDVPMLRLGSALSPQFRVEALLGYRNDGFTIETTAGDTEYDLSAFAIGGSAFYVIASPANTVFSIGGSIVYGTSNIDPEGAPDEETSTLAFFPVMRVDFAIPGAERFALFTEYGARYVSATTTIDDVEYKYSDLSTWGSENILGGAYYSF